MAQRTEYLIALVALAALIVGCVLVLAPFVSALLWAVIICFSTWGAYERLLKLVRGRESLAAGIMTLLLAVILIGPLVVVGVSLGDNAKHLTEAIRRWTAEGFPAPPDWLAGLPLVGPKLNVLWLSLEADSTKFIAYLKRLAAPVSKWLLGTGLAFGQGLLYLTLSVLTAYFLYRDGTDVARRARAGMERIAGARAYHLLEVAGNTVKGVVYGIIGAALAQGIMAGLGYATRGWVLFISSILLSAGLVWFTRWLLGQHNIIMDPLYVLLPILLCGVLLPVVKLSGEKKIAEETVGELREELKRLEGLHRG